MKSDTTALGNLVEALEVEHEEIYQAVDLLRDRACRHDSMIKSLLLQLDYENQEQMQNIYIRDFPEATQNCDFIPTLQGLFVQVLGDAAPIHIEIDCAHRALLLPPQDIIKTQDVICRIHKYAVKEAIITVAHGKQCIDFDGAQLSLFPDLFKKPLMIYRVVCPVLEFLCQEGVTYSITGASHSDSL